MLSNLALFTLFHVFLSLVAIGAGFVVMADLLRSRVSRGLNGFFLATTVLTSVTGFGFPFQRISPAHVLAVVSLLVLAGAYYAFYSRQLVGRWRSAYVVAVFAAQYVNVFVLIVQSFQKVPALHALAPTQTEWPFVLTQGLTFLAFVVWGFAATTHLLPLPATANRRTTT